MKEENVLVTKARLTSSKYIAQYPVKWWHSHTCFENENYSSFQQKFSHKMEFWPQFVYSLIFFEHVRFVLFFFICCCCRVYNSRYRMRVRANPLNCDGWYIGFVHIHINGIGNCPFVQSNQKLVFRSIIYFS